MASLLVPGAVFVGSLAVLLASSDRFTAAAERVGLSLGVSPFIIGATLVAGGTSLPELVSSVLAVRAGAPAIVVGNVVGSNVANILLILGVAAIAGPTLRIDRELMRVDLPLLMAAAGFLVVAVWNGPFTRLEGLLGLVGLGTYMHFTFSDKDRLDEVVEDLVTEYVDADEAPAPADVEAVAAETHVGARTLATVVVSLVLVFLAAEGLVRSILSLAAALDVGAEFVAITAVAIGTSLPEIAVSVAAVRRSDFDIAVGNVLGSNIFNTFAVMGVPSFLGSLAVPPDVRTYALPVMLLATLLYYFITQDREITAWEGVALLVLYATFLFNLATVV